MVPLWFDCFIAMTSVTKTEEIFQNRPKRGLSSNMVGSGADLTQIVIMKNCLDLSMSCRITSWLKATIM